MDLTLDKNEDMGKKTQVYFIKKISKSNMVMLSLKIFPRSSFGLAFITITLRNPQSC